MNSVPLSLDFVQKSPYRIAPFFSRTMDSGAILITNDRCEHAFLSGAEFAKILEGQTLPTTLVQDLTEGGFLQSLPEELFATQEASAVSRVKDYLFLPTSLFIIVLTLECDHDCTYCQAKKARDRRSGTHMSIRTARKVVERVFDSPSSNLTIEFQGGEPLLNFDALRTVVQYSKESAARTGKQVAFQITTNLQNMTEEKAVFLAKNNIAVCTSCDGPAELHNANRPSNDPRGSFATMAEWTERLNRLYRKMNVDRQVSALATTTRESLRFPEEIVDTYLDLGFESVFLRPLSPFGKAAARAEYTPEEFSTFYRSVFSAILERASLGRNVREGFAAIFAKKVFRKEPVNYMELRSPCGAGIGQIAFDWNGDVYTCDEGRMLGQAGDQMFCLGNVEDEAYGQWLRKDIVKKAAIASCVECHPHCCDCAFGPFCGLCPVYNHAVQESLIGDMSKNDLCQIRQELFSFLFSLLEDPDGEARKVLRSWAD